MARPVLLPATTGSVTLSLLLYNISRVIYLFWKLPGEKEAVKVLQANKTAKVIYAGFSQITGSVLIPFSCRLLKKIMAKVLLVFGGQCTYMRQMDI